MKTAQKFELNKVFVIWYVSFSLPNGIRIKVLYEVTIRYSTVYWWPTLSSKPSSYARFVSKPFQVFGIYFKISDGHKLPKVCGWNCVETALIHLNVSSFFCTWYYSFHVFKCIIQLNKSKITPYRSGLLKKHFLCLLINMAADDIFFWQITDNFKTKVR